MTNTITQPLLGKDLYLAEHLRLLQRPLGPGGALLDSLRKRGLDQFVKQGFPTTRDEAWRQTSISGLVNTPLRAAFANASEEPDHGLLEMFRYAGLSGPEVIFHNGQLVRINGAERLPAGVLLLEIGTAIEQHRHLIEPHLGAYATFEEHPFVALNTAFIDAGAVLIVPRGVVLEQPIHFMFLSSGGGNGAEGYHSHPRLLVLAGENSQATIIETWGSAEDGAVYFNNPVTEIAAAENAIVHHVKVQRESSSAFHIAAAQFHQARGSQVHSHVITLGGGLVRNELGSVLDGEGAHCMLNGLYITSGTQHIDNHTVLDHAKPHCTSHEAYKGILDDQSSGVFTGRIMVRQDAQKTDAIQSNRALLLNPQATINSQPQLEIFADDVKCTHGATVGQLNAEALFYLRTRGINRDAAQGILTYAFANEIIDQIPAEPVRALLERHLAVHFDIIAEETVA